MYMNPVWEAGLWQRDLQQLSGSFHFDFADLLHNLIRCIFCSIFYCLEHNWSSAANGVNPANGALLLQRGGMEREAQRAELCNVRGCVPREWGGRHPWGCPRALGMWH